MRTGTRCRSPFSHVENGWGRGHVSRGSEKRSIVTQERRKERRSAVVKQSFNSIAQEGVLSQRWPAATKNLSLTFLPRKNLRLHLFEKSFFSKTFARGAGTKRIATKPGRKDRRGLEDQETPSEAEVSETKLPRDNKHRQRKRSGERAGEEWGRETVHALQMSPNISFWYSKI